MKKEYEFNVDGMHCAACELVIEKKLSKLQGLKKINVDLAKCKLTIESEENVNLDVLNALVFQDGYKIYKGKKIEHVINKDELVYGFAFAAMIALLFFVLQKTGIVNLLNSTEVSLPFVFMVGIVASLSTCMAVVGGIVLSISSTLSRQKNTRPLIIFHIARLIGFFVLGGLIGLLGSALILTPQLIFVMNTILFIVMVIMAINLLDIFPKAGKFQFRLPKSWGRKVDNLNGNSNSFAAALVGISTFILPCGFTQSMQVYALSTKSFSEGALTMFVFALGTLPVLALISFASVKFSQGLRSGLFYKTAGFLILFFAIFNFLGGLVAIGILSPIFNI
jgi:sulfite exporter TauE/SafE/copper chaperone CopZ